MPYVMFHAKVEDYAKWRTVFDGNTQMRRDFHSKGGYILQSADDPNELVVFLEWDSLDEARAFIQSDALREALRRSGVAGQPTIAFLNEVGRPEA